MGLVELPDDVLLLIYSYLAIEDVLALKQVSLVDAHTTADTRVLTKIHADMPCPTRLRNRRLSLAQASRAV